MTADYDHAQRIVSTCWSIRALIGLIETVPQDDELLIVNVAVAPEQQGQGYGSC
jgi:ribosomal protein S18 acetylase RimI-like enzyme